MRLAWHSLRGGALVAAAAALSLLSCRSGGAGSGEPRFHTRLVFAGATAFPRSRLEEAIELDLEDLEHRSSPKSAIDDAAYSLLEFYRSQGFVDCTVDYQLESEGPRELTATFGIREGPRCALVAVTLLGDLERDAEELLAAIGFDDLGSRREPRWYVASEVEDAAAELEGYYASLGYLEATVSEPRIELDRPHQRARVTMLVDTGVRHRVFGAPRLHGGIPQIDREIELGAYAGRPMSPRLPVEIRGRIEEEYARRGHPEVEATLRESERDEEGRIQLDFDVEPGPRVRISKVRVTGNEKTREEHVIERLRLEPGDLYDVRKVRESFRQLYRTGLFRRVSLTLEPGAGGERALLVDLEELPPTEFFLEPGYGSYEGLRVLAGARENNIFGTTRSLQGEVLLAERARRVAAGVGDRRLFGSDLEGSLSVFQEVRDEPSFDEDQRGLALSVSREIERRFRVSADYRFSRSELSNVDIADPIAADALQDVDISSVTLSGAYDRRDSVFVPSRGHLIKLSFELATEALGSELDFVRFRLSHASFFPLGEDTVIGASWRAGAISPIEDTSTIPLQERFFNGGENTVRSFEEDELGPEDSSGNPLGGEAFHVVSLELRRRLTGNLEGAAFYDGGNVETNADDLFLFEGFRHGLGLGLRYLLPIGPIRLDGAVNPDPRPDEDDWVLHFTVGTSF